MVKSYWLVVAFGAGIAAGFMLSHREAPRLPPVVGAVSAQDVASTPLVPAPPPERQVVVADTRPAASAPVPAVAEEGEYSGYSQPIDVGAAFRKTLEAPPPPGAANAFADAHHALEREARDDSWSYPLEAEIQNSLVAETSMGNFNLDHVECRATMCEVRLSGKGEEQEAALKRWSDGMHSLPWSSRLYASVTSSITENGRVDQVMILKRR